MATDKTKLTELGTAAGLFWTPGGTWPDSLEALDIPGIDAAVWRPVLLPATRTADPQRDLLLRALHNGHAFRAVVLRGRRPEHVQWTGASRQTWTSDIPRDLTVDGVYFVQAKYDSTCVLNTAPASMIDHLALDEAAGTHRSWYETVALRALQHYYTTVRARVGASDLPTGARVDLPTDVRDLDADHRALLKDAMRASSPDAKEDEAYHELCRAVSVETELRWTQRLQASTTAQQTQMLFRMLRIAGGPYWLLGTKGHAPVQLAVADTRTWRERFTLKRFSVTAGQAGQPQVDWRAIVTDRATRERIAIDGMCEIRWSHRKLQGPPECKVQVLTPLEQLPGYDAMI